ncbi:hypothetical protein QA612_06640 [Evansella sp. AB-P1]|nr:hypothetical protein [Evansella sp. AB-P1]MDG5787164.1 hypothetical protein [Evansella sp. AB-P1]
MILSLLRIRKKGSKGNIYNIEKAEQRLHQHKMDVHKRQQIRIL